MASKNSLVPVWEKYILSLEEAAQYFHTGEKKLRRLAEENPPPKWALMNSSRLQIKRKILEQAIDDLYSF